MVRLGRRIDRTVVLICPLYRHIYMVISEIVTLLIYLASMAFLPEYFGMFSVLLSSPWANADVFRESRRSNVCPFGRVCVEARSHCCNQRVAAVHN